MNYDISVIIPVFNSEVYLAQTLGNVLNQTKPEIQIILVNDASTDDSLRIINDAKAEYGDRVVIIDMPENSGPGAARNRALDIAEGEYIGFVDSDDIVDVSMYEKLYSKAKSESADIVDCAYYRDTTNKALIHFSKEFCGVLDDEKRSALICCGGYNCMKIFKKSLLDENKIRFRPVYILEDTDFLIKALIYAKKVAAVEDVLYRYTNNDTSLSSEEGFSRYINAQLDAIRAVYEVSKKSPCYEGIQDAIECIILYMYKNILVMIAQSEDKVPYIYKKEMFYRASELRNKTVKRSLGQNRFVKIKLDSDEINLIANSDKSEKGIVTENTLNYIYSENNFPFSDYLNYIGFHDKKTPSNIEGSGVKIWRNITSEYTDKSANRVSKDIKVAIASLLDTMTEMTNEIKTNWNGISNTYEFLSLFQEAAISVGEQIEQQLGPNKITSSMEYLCESIYNLGLDNCDVANLQKSIEHHITSAKNELSNLPEKYTCFFLPYQYSMWDSMEIVWKEASNDPNWDVFIMPIPYFDRNPDGSVGDSHYDGKNFIPDYNIIGFNDVDLAALHPNVIFFHYPYDQYNFVTMVHPDYFSTVLKSCTDTLVYIPYYVHANDNVGSYMIRTPGILNADKVMLNSDHLRGLYIKYYREWMTELGHPGLLKECEKKFITTGSPKIDRVLLADEEKIKLPTEWNKVIPKNKKIVLLDANLGALMPANGRNSILKFNLIFNTIKSRDDIFLIWRPHPLSHKTIKSMNPEILDEFIKLENEIDSSDWGILDTSKDMLPAIIISDAYYGSTTSIYELYKNLKKPMLLYNINLLK